MLRRTKSAHQQELQVAQVEGGGVGIDRIRCKRRDHCNQREGRACRVNVMPATGEAQLITQDAWNLFEVERHGAQRN